MKGLLIILLFLSACGKGPARKSSETKQEVSGIYASSLLKVNVYYEEGAEPYTDKVLSLELWNLLRSNLNSLLEGRNISVEVPSTLPQMVKISPQSKTSWSVQEVMDLAKKYPLSEPPNVSEFQIFFLNGLADGNPGVIGYHISHTKIMAIFKDVIKSSGSNNQDFVPKYVEQATLIHEMGHALGLVNNGIPMIQNHQDVPHGAHCSNPDCVMYYSNEGASNMIKFAKSSYAKGTVIMFDNQCLEDSRRFQK
ncbi:MAG: hypothetical protein ACLGHN_00310 [Bacteriovoracia bacterium]